MRPRERTRASPALQRPRGSRSSGGFASFSTTKVTVAGAKKRLEAEISEGRFDEGLERAPLRRSRRAAPREPSRPKSPRRGPGLPVGFPRRARTRRRVFGPAGKGATRSDFPDRKRVLKELKESQSLDRAAARAETKGPPEVRPPPHSKPAMAAHRHANNRIEQPNNRHGPRQQKPNRRTSGTTLPARGRGPGEGVPSSARERLC